MEAAKAYDTAAFKLRGSKAILNFPHDIGNSPVQDNRKRSADMITDAEEVEMKVPKKEEDVIEEEKSTTTTEISPLTPSNWTGVWENDKGIFKIPLLSPLPPPCSKLSTSI